MKFVYQTITDPLQDTQQNFEQLESIGMLLASHNLADVQSVSRALGTLLGATFTQVGTGTLTWPAATSLSNVLSIALPGATGTVHALANPISYVLIPAVFDSATAIICTPNGSGGVSFVAQTRAAGNPGATGTMTFAYLMWGS